MRSAKAAYDRYLQGMAEETPAGRPKVVYALAAPWFAPPTLLILANEALGLSRQALTPFVLITFALGVAGCWYAFAKFLAYRAQVDRRPPVWADTPNGRLLFEALQRWSLRGFSDVAPNTLLATDLKLTPREMSGVLADLANELGLDALPLPRDPTSDVTAQEVLDAMSQS